MLHTHWTWRFALQQKRKLTSEESAFAFKLSGNESFVWRIQLTGEIRTDFDHVGAEGKVGCDVPIGRKKKEKNKTWSEVVLP